MKVGIVGATGYVGSELARWILHHPVLQLSTVISRSHTGKAYGTVVPALAGLVELPIQAFDEAALAGLDVVFLATPHGAAAPLIPALAATPIVVDLSADHRHADGWVYGQPEWCAESLGGATRIAAPGCFATALELALAPLVAAGMLDGPAMVTAATGSTGSGASLGEGTHHPLRATNLKAYKVLSHQHVPEVRTFLGGLGTAPAVNFVPLSAPIDRGILASVLVTVSGNAESVIHDAYARSPLVRLRSGSPELRHVRGTAFADVAVVQQGDVASILVAIDNLGKGAASQAIQALNLAVGHRSDLGLRVPALTP